jgi:hypothetical protein
MTAVQRVFLGLSVALLTVVLAGLFRRRLYRFCYTFPVYLLAVWAGDLLQLTAARIFYALWFYQAKETLYVVLKLAVALEITALAYQAFPAAHAAARRAILAVLVGLLLLVTLGVPYGQDSPSLVLELTRRLTFGTILVFCATWALVLWYHLPLHRLHRAIIRGLVPYMLVFAAVNGLMLTFGWNIRRAVNLADAVAWNLMLAYWAWEVWRTPPMEPPFLQTLQRWRGRV